MLERIWFRLVWLTWLRDGKLDVDGEEQRSELSYTPAGSSLLGSRITVSRLYEAPGFSVVIRSSGTPNCAAREEGVSPLRIT